MNALGLLRAADRYKINEELLDIPLDGDAVIKCKLISPDLFELQEELEDLKKAALVEGRQKGWHKLPIDEDEWQSEIDGWISSKEYKEMNPKDRKKRLNSLQSAKPKNLAEQRAPYKARLRIIRSILPRLLRDVETGEKLFQTQEEIDAVSNIIGANTNLMGLLSKAYGRLAEKNSKDNEDASEIKNVLTAENLENGS